MKILFDTSVLIAAFVTRGQTFDLIKDAVFRHEVVCTEYVLNEFKQVMEKKFDKKLSHEARALSVFVLKKYFIHGVSAPHVEAVCRDPKDDPILADAVANDVDLIVTGDKDLLVLKKHKQIRIISPNEYWNL